MIRECVDATGIGDAIASAVAGDIVQINDGTYQLPGIAWTRSNGTTAAPIVVKANNPGKVIIESNGHEEALRIVNAYWRIEGLTIRATKGSNYAIKFESGARYGIVRECGIEVGDQSECGIKLAGASDPRECPDGALIENNRITMKSPTKYMMAEGVDCVACERITIRSNFVSGFKTAANGVAFGLMAKGNCGGVIIERNVCFNNFIGISLGGGGTANQYVRNGDTAQESRSGIIRSNVIARSHDVAIYLYAARGTKVHSNWCYESFVSLGAGGTSIDVRMPGTGNDVALNSLDKPIRGRDGGNYGERSNNYAPPYSQGSVVFTPR